MSKNDRQQALVPRLRFPEFRDAPAWKEKQLKHLFDERTEKGGEELPLLSLTEVEGLIRQEHSGRKDNSNADKSRYARVYPGDIAYNTMRMWEGRNALSCEAGLVSPAYTVCMPKDSADSRFFAYYFKTAQAIAQFRRFSQGLVKDTLSLKFDRFAKIQLPTTSPAEQHKIADCLGSLDDLITAEGRKLAALRDHKKGLMQQLFPREGETRPRLRLPEFRNAPEWNRVPLDDLVKIASGLVSPIEPPFCHLPHVGSDNIESHSGYLSGLQTAKELRLISGKYYFDHSYILYSKIRPALNKVAAPTFEGICSADIYPIRPSTAELRRDYLYYLLLCDGFLAYAVKHSARSKIPKLNRDTLLAYEAPVPNAAEQHRVADCLSSLDALITAQAEKLEALRSHKRGLMQKLFPSPEDHQ